MSTDEIVQRRVQQKGRVDVPDEIWDMIGLSVGESVFVYEDSGQVIIRPAKASELK